MTTDILMNGSTVKNHISFKTVFGYSATRRTSFQSWFLVYQRVLPSFPSSTSLTPSRQEIDHPTSSSSSFTSPTTNVSSDSEIRAREDLCGIDSYPVSVSSEYVERKERGDQLTKPTKNPLQKKRRPRVRTGRPGVSRNSGMAATIQRKSCG